MEKPTHAISLPSGRRWHLLVSGVKDVENRHVSENAIGQLPKWVAVHLSKASKPLLGEEVANLSSEQLAALPTEASFDSVRGTLVGAVEVTSVRRRDDETSKWKMGGAPFCWKVGRVVRVRPAATQIVADGKVGLWPLDGQLADALLLALEPPADGTGGAGPSAPPAASETPPPLDRMDTPASLDALPSWRSSQPAPPGFSFLCFRTLTDGTLAASFLVEEPFTTIVQPYGTDYLVTLGVPIGGSILYLTTSSVYCIDYAMVLLRMLGVHMPYDGGRSLGATLYFRVGGGALPEQLRLCILERGLVERQLGTLQANASTWNAHNAGKLERVRLLTFADRVGTSDQPGAKTKLQQQAARRELMQHIKEQHSTQLQAISRQIQLEAGTRRASKVFKLVSSATAGSVKISATADSSQYKEMVDDAFLVERGTTPLTLVEVGARILFARRIAVAPSLAAPPAPVQAATAAFSLIADSSVGISWLPAGSLFWPISLQVPDAVTIAEACAALRNVPVPQMLHLLSTVPSQACAAGHVALLLRGCARQLAEGTAAPGVVRPILAALRSAMQREIEVEMMQSSMLIKSKVLYASLGVGAHADASTLLACLSGKTALHYLSCVSKRMLILSATPRLWVAATRLLRGGLGLLLVDAGHLKGAAMVAAVSEAAAVSTRRAVCVGDIVTHINGQPLSGGARTVSVLLNTLKPGPVRLSLRVDAKIAVTAEGDGDGEDEQSGALGDGDAAAAAAKDGVTVMPLETTVAVEALPLLQSPKWPSAVDAVQLQAALADGCARQIAQANFVSNRHPGRKIFPVCVGAVNGRLGFHIEQCEACGSLAAVGEGAEASAGASEGDDGLTRCCSHCTCVPSPPGVPTLPVLEHLVELGYPEDRVQIGTVPTQCIYGCCPEGTMHESIVISTGELPLQARMRLNESLEGAPLLQVQRELGMAWSVREKIAHLMGMELRKGNLTRCASNWLTGFESSTQTPDQTKPLAYSHQLTNAAATDSL